MKVDAAFGAPTGRVARGAVTWTMLASLAVLWGLFALWAYGLRESRLHTMEQVLDRQRAALAEHIDGTFTIAETILAATNRWIADHPERDPRIDSDFAKLIQDLQRVTSPAMTYRLVDADGDLTLIPQTPGAKAANVADRDYVVGALAKPPGEITISAPYQGRATGHWAIAVSTKLAVPSHRLVVADIAIEIDLFETAFAKARIGEGSVISLIRRDGVLLARSAASHVELGTNLAQSAVFARGLPQAREGVLIGDAVLTDGVRRQIAFGALKTYPLVVVVGAPLDTVAAETRSTILWVALIMALVSVLLLASRAKIVDLLDDLTTSHQRLLASRDRLAAEVEERRQIEARLTRSEANLLKLVATDALTDLVNRRHFDERAEEEFRRARRLDQDLAILMADVDHFKRINDTWGHSTGDAALKAVAGILRATVRDIDIVGRYGGEEFAALLPGTDRSGALDAAERLRLAVRELVILAEDGAPVPLSISVGAAVLEAGDEDFARTLMRADGAMYRAKAEGRDRVVAAE